MPNPTDITATINDLVPDHEYFYQFSGQSNWPTTVNPISGSFYASNYIQPITASVYFCPNKTSCDDNNGLIDCSDSSCGVGDLPFVLIGLSYYDAVAPTVKYSSNFITVYNSGYQLPNPVLSIKSSGAMPHHTFNEYDQIEISSHIDNLIFNETYYYEFRSLDNNYSSSIVPSSGYFTAHSKSQEINAGMYLLNTNNSDSAAKKGNIYFNNIDFAIRPSGENRHYISNSITVNFVARDLPNPILSVKSIIASGNNAFNEYDKVEISSHIDNLISDETYYYEFRNLDNNYSSSIVPTSGYFTARSQNQRIDAAVYLLNENNSVSSSKNSNIYFNTIDFVVKPTGENRSYSSNSVTVNFATNNPIVSLSQSTPSLSSEEYRDISVFVSGIVPNTEYVYEFDSVGSNWPTTIANRSGILQSNTDTFTINSIVFFCPNMVSCTGNNVLPWNDVLSGYDTELFTNLNCKIYPVYSDTNVSYSNILNFKHISKMPTATIAVDTSGSINEEKTLEVAFVNLKPNKLYSYNIYSVESNWPFAVSDSSGNFYSQSTSYSLNVLGSFCENSGVCPPNSYGVLHFEPVVPIKLSWYKPQITLRLSFEDVDFPSLTYYSNVANISCLDCAPKHKSVNISINPIPDC